MTEFITCPSCGDLFATILVEDSYLWDTCSFCTGYYVDEPADYPDWL